ncbi:MAG: caspase family protein [Caulobacter sp.]|nr:caspase family protein [Caulobacter sp.]
MGRGLGVIVMLLAVFTASTTLAQTRTPAGTPRSPFNDWSAIVVAGDWRAAGGAPTEAFDNARRDVAATLTSLGFRPENVSQFTTRPERYADSGVERLTAQSMGQALKSSAARTSGGCLIYYTSHGNRDGAVLDVMGRMYMFSPSEMAAMVDDACPGRPAIVFISACYSGVFVPHLSGPQRMVVTAARPDRSSFGCGVDFKYPFFDDCFLQSVAGVKNFPALPPAIQQCVAAKETAMGVGPPSEPQSSIGAELRTSLSLMPFPRGARGSSGP